MECELCKQSLIIANSAYRRGEGATDVFCDLSLVCVNPNCACYSGTDLSNPLMIAKTVSNQVAE